MHRVFYVFLTIALFLSLADSSVSAKDALAVPPPARLWFLLDIDELQTIEFVVCNDSACQSELSRYTTTFSGTRVIGTQGPGRYSYDDGFGCSGLLCSIQYSRGEEDLRYRLIATVDGVAHASDVGELKRWNNEVVNWSVRLDDGQLLLQPEASIRDMRVGQPLHNFWGTQQGFSARWLLVAVAEMLVLLGLFTVMGRRQALPYKLILMVFCINLILYAVLALGIGSWRPLVSSGQRFFGVVSFILATIYLSFAYWFYAVEGPSLAAKVSTTVTTTALLAIPGFFLMVIGGFASADQTFNGLPVETTIAVAFVVAVLLDGGILFLIERQLLGLKWAFGTSLVLNAASFGLLFTLSVMNL